MVTRTNAIKAVLNGLTHPDLAALYNHDMECQVIVAQDNGERIEGEYNGVKWAGYTDNLSTWKPFRIPRNASTTPEYTDTDMTYDLAIHAEGIGMTGWDWKSRVSKWVAFDFDAILGHSEKHAHKLTSEELRKVQDVATNLEWVTVRYSTSGKGLHLYVFLDNVPTANHTEHAALARSILGKMSALTGYDFQSKVDICGGNMWVWHRKMRTPDGSKGLGLQLIKQGGILKDIPPNWRDNLNVVKGVTRKLTAPTDIQNLPDTEDRFDVLCGQRTRVKLDEDHIKLIKYLNENGLYHWWDADRHMLVTHTASLKRAHTEMGLRGIFETETKATSTHNCFCYPMRKGAWSVRRFSPGCKEHPSWDQDGAGWTRCYLNQEPTLKSASHAHQGIEDPSGGFHFTTGQTATEAANLLGANAVIPPRYAQRPTNLKPHKDGNRIIIEFPHESSDVPTDLPGWLQKGSKWIKIFSAQRITTTDVDAENYDDLVRHLVNEAGEDSGWVVASDGKWNDEPLQHVKAALQSMGMKRPDIDVVIGSGVLKPWNIVARPFQPEYPGDRVWNRFAPQLRYPPTVGDRFEYPTWQRILNHIGKGLDKDIQNNAWAKKNGIITGADYLRLWIASMIQFPNEPLPYLFIYGEKQETGKSTFHESLGLLFEPGYMHGKHALQNKGNFNAELEGMILIVIEEIDLNRDKTAYERIKEWVTSPKLSIHRKSTTPYMIDNTTHYVQTANPRSACPIFPGDTRITMIHVTERPGEEVPKRVLFKQLEKEAPDFLGHLLSLEIPDCDSRLRIPVIETSDKRTAQEIHRSALEEFIDEKCHFFPGRTISLAEFYDAFQQYLDPADRLNWNSKQKVSAAMPDWVVKGRFTGNAQWQWGNISFSAPTEEELKQPSFITINNYLARETPNANEADH